MAGDKHGIQDKELARLVEVALAQGWTLHHGRTHLQLRSPDGLRQVFFPSTPSDRRAIHNIRATLRRNGMKLVIQTKRRNQ